MYKDGHQAALLWLQNTYSRRKNIEDSGEGVVYLCYLATEY
jgi:hypothetical protein